MWWRCYALLFLLLRGRSGKKHRADYSGTCRYLLGARPFFQTDIGPIKSRLFYNMISPLAGFPAFQAAGFMRAFFPDDGRPSAFGRFLCLIEFDEFLCGSGGE